MPPIRRYLRLTKYSVLEVRVYLDKPSDAPWLLSSRDPVLARILEEVRPKVLPKLREENENARKKGGKKKKGIKDVASQGIYFFDAYAVLDGLTFWAMAEDFEVTIFLTETSTRHSLLTKHKSFADKPKLKSTGNKLTGWLNTGDNPIHIEDEETPALLREEDDDVQELHDIPATTAGDKRKPTEDGEDDAGFVSSSDEEFFQTQRERSSKRRKKGAEKVSTSALAEELEAEDLDDKKKLDMNTSYDGFSIYGRILCLVVKRKGKKALSSDAHVGGSQMMEQWVSTQAAQEGGLGDDDER